MSRHMLSADRNNVKGVRFPGPGEFGHGCIKCTTGSHRQAGNADIPLRNVLAWREEGGEGRKIMPYK
jgi:hypothetical protein